MFPPLFSPPWLPGHFPTQQPREQAIQTPLSVAKIDLPVGAIVIFPGQIIQQSCQLSTAMTDLRYMPWMICDGSSLLITEYPALYRVIGDLYGSSGEGRFNLPDYRGYFLRGVDLQKTRDKDERTPPNGASVNPQGIGSTQEDAMQEHQHLLQMQSSAIPSGAQSAQPVVSPNGSSKTGNIDQMGGVRVSNTETRATNISVNFLIKTQ